jgi:hypothetical protein
MIRMEAGAEKWSKLVAYIYLIRPQYEVSTKPFTIPQAVKTFLILSDSAGGDERNKCQVISRHSLVLPSSAPRVIINCFQFPLLPQAL